MEWKGRRQSTNVEDRRGRSTGGIAIGGGIGAVIITLLGLFLGGSFGNLGNIFGDANSLLPTATTTAQAAATDDEMTQFVKTVLADTEDFWTQEFQSMGKTYVPPEMVLFTGSTPTASGTATSATGPFYSPADKELFIDLSFYEELTTRFGAKGGDFAEAYVIAHEIGHAVQDQLGILDQVDAQRAQESEEEANQMSVRLELQADFLAGVWGHYANSIGELDPGEINEALDAANAIGDDRLQKEAQGYVVPDSFTHGTSAQRAKWFKLGYDTGDINQGDTFSIPYDQL